MKQSGFLVVSSTVILLLGLSFFLSSPVLNGQQQNSVHSTASIPHNFIGTYTCSSSTPCPMGVADYGTTGQLSYEYNATAFVSWANFTTLNIGLATPIGHLRDSFHMSIQQNLVAYNIYENGNYGEYWAQDVPFIKQSLSGGTYQISQVDNIWNFSSPNANMSGTIYGNIPGGCSSYGGQPTYYYCEGDQIMTTTLPFEVQMVQVAEKYGTGFSALAFAIYVYHAGVIVGGGQFDLVAFSGNTGLSPVFHVGGTNPRGLYNDAETVLCGPGGGSSVKIKSIQATISEAYSDSITLSGGLTPVPHAWSAGSDTAETVSGVQMSSTIPGVGIASSGTDNNVQIW